MLTSNTKSQFYLHDKGGDVFLNKYCYKSCYGEEKTGEGGKKKDGKLLCHLVAGTTLLANMGHSCVPAGASRWSPRD